MNSKVLKVFYGADNLPYKDKERVVHFPVVGGTFMGASNTTEIWFYFDKIGEPNNTWVAIAKLPNGKRGAVKLDTFNDTELNEPYAKLQLNTWFTQMRGDVYISLNGYDGGITLSLDQETGLYEVTGTPVIQATGSVKLTIQYATQLIGGEEIDEITLQYLYSLFGEKLNTNEGIVVIANPQVDITQYDVGQYFYSKSDNSIYEKVVNEAEPILRFTAYSKSESDTLLATKVDKLTTSGVFAYIHNGNVQGELAVSTPATGDTIAKREYDGRLKVAPPASNGDATPKQYVDTQIDKRVAKTNVGDKVYGTDESGNQKTFDVDSDFVSGENGIVVRRLYPNGQVIVGNPSATNHATPKQYVDNNFAHTLDLTIDSNFDLVVKLLNANGVVISQDDVDLPLESIVVSATYYDTYTYEGTTYNKVIVIVLSTTSVPTIIPVGDLVSGLVSTDELATALADYYTKTQVDTLLNSKANDNSVVHLTGNETISGTKLFNDFGVRYNDNNYWKIGTDTLGNDQLVFSRVLEGGALTPMIKFVADNIIPEYNNTGILGSSTNKWKDLYLGGELKDGTNSISIANIQEKLVSGTNIKSINNTSLLGSGNIDYDNALSDSSTNAVQNKVLKGYLDDIGNRLAVLEESIISDDSLNYTYLSDSAIPTNANTYPIIESAGMDNTNIKGNSFVYNQLVENGNFESTSGWETSGLIISVSNNICNINPTTNNCYIRRQINNIISGHKYFLIMPYEINNSARVNIYLGSQNIHVGAPLSPSGWKNRMYVFQSNISGNNNLIFSFYVEGEQSPSEIIINLTNIQLIDLTQSGLDSVATTDEATAELAKRGINVYEYNQYSSGKIKDSKPTALISKSFNVWDEEWEESIYNVSTGEKQSGYTNQIRCKNLIRVLPNTTYYFKCPTILWILEYGSNGEYLGIYTNKHNATLTLSSNTHYITFYTVNTYGTTYNNDICINISNATLNGQYRPYKAPISYPLSLPVLRSAGSVQDDTKKVRIGSYTFTGNETYTTETNGIQIKLNNYINDIGYEINAVVTNAVMDKLTRVNWGNIGSSSGSFAITRASDSYIALRANVSSASYLIGMILYYELATPTDQPAITLPENIEFEKGGSLEVTYDSTAPTPADFDFEVAVYKPIE